MLLRGLLVICLYVCIICIIQNLSTPLIFLDISTHTHTQNSFLETVWEVRSYLFHEAYVRSEHLCSELPWKEHSLASKYKFTNNSLFASSACKDLNHQFWNPRKYPESTSWIYHWSGKSTEREDVKYPFLPADFPLQLVVCCSHYYYYYCCYYYCDPS